MALMTAAQARVYIPTLTSTGEDTNIDTLIARADAAMASWCGYPPVIAATPVMGLTPTLEDQTYVLYNGRGGLVRVLDSRHIQCDVWPVISITSIYDDTSEAYGTAVTSTDYTLIDGNQGLIAYDADSGKAWADSGPTIRNIKLTAVCGWATIPGDILQAAGLLVAHWWQLRHTQGRTNVSTAGGGSAGLRDEELPASVKQLLSPYRLPRVWL
jgi:hypothetical protein